MLDIKMAPQSPKRRKLDHDGRINSDHDRSDIPDTQDIQQNDSREPSEVTSKGISKPFGQSDGPRQTKEIEDSAQHAGDSYKSSIFKLQIDELLAEVQKQSSERLQQVDKALRTLKTAIEGIEEKGAITVSQRLFLLLGKTDAL